MWKQGDRLENGDYIIEKKIGEGGFGITYLAKDKRDNLVVIKTLNENTQNHPEFEKLRQDFLNEARRLAECKGHAHIVSIKELFEEGETRLPCIVMEYIPGKNLATLVQDEVRLSETVALGYIHQIGDALDVMHQKGLLHRDVKPNNIIVRENTGKAVLIDFGIAREFDHEEINTLTAFSSGGYTPIEQYESKAKQDNRTDIYALAATLYYLLTKKYPENAQNRSDSVKYNQNDSLVPPKKHNPDISDRVNNAIIQGMGLNIKSRPRTIKQWLSLLSKSNPSIATSEVLFQNQPSKTKGSKNFGHKILSGLAYCSLIFLGLFFVVPFFIVPVDKRGSMEQIEAKESKYENTEYNFSMKYPAGWSLIAGQANDFTNIVAELFAPSTEDLGWGEAKVIVEVRELDKTKSLTDITEETSKEITQLDKEAKILSKEEIVWANKRGYKLVYTGKDGENSIKRMRVGTINNYQEYTITYEAEMSRYADFEEVAQKAIDSFKFLPDN